MVGLGVAVRPLKPKGNVADSQGEGYFEVHLLSLYLGLRFPLHPALVDILNYYQLVLGRLVPNSHNLIVAFFSPCKAIGIPLSLELFCFMFHISCASIVQSKGFVVVYAILSKIIFNNLNTFNMAWKTKFVFVLMGSPPSYSIHWSPCFCKHRFPRYTPKLATSATVLVVEGDMLSVGDYVTEESLAKLGFIRT